MKKWTVHLLFLTCLLGYSSDLPEEQFIDAYDDQNGSYGETYARLTYVGKNATIFHEGRVEEPAVRNLPVVSGDLLKTGYSTFAELEFIDGSLLQIADRAEIEAQAINEVYSQESLTVLRLLEGQIFLHVANNRQFEQNQVFRIDSRAGSAYIEAPGIYMLSYKSGRLKLKTYRGLAELSGEYSSVLVHSGEFSSIRGMARPLRTTAFNSFRGNDFERWAYDRRPILNSASARYVDAPVASYSRDLDDHGEWRYDNSISTHVWVPYTRKSWRPYHNGYWSPIRGRLTWVSHDPFGYVTHHYGRWGWSLDFGWYWVPGSTYSPAWVAWSTYDSYIGWCPLGYWNRPYYYYRNGNHTSVFVNNVIINNHTQRWNYISISDVHTRRAVRVANRKPSRTHVRRITTRPISILESDLRDGRRIARVIRDPKVNRERTASRVGYRGEIVSHRSVGTVSRTRIQARDSGTSAASRYAQTTRQVRRQRTNPEGSSLVTRSASRTQSTTRQSQHGTRGTAQRQSSRTTRSQDRTTIKRSETRNRSTAQRRNSRTTAPSSRSRSQADRPINRRANPSRTSPPKRSQARQNRKPSSTAPPRRNRTQTNRNSTTQRQRIQRPSNSGRQRSTAPSQRQSNRQATPAPRRQSNSRTSQQPRRQSNSRATQPRQSNRRATPPPRQSNRRASQAPRQSNRRATQAPRQSNRRATQAPRQSNRSSATRSSARQQRRPAPVKRNQRPPKKDNKQ